MSAKPDYQTADRGWCGDPKRGAAMGRGSDLPDDTEGPLTLRHVPLDSGGYDPGGTYWGSPDDLYMVSDADDRVCYTRAASRDAVKAQFSKATWAKVVEVTEGDIDDILQGYVECALWSETDDEGEPLDNRFNESDLTDAARADMREACAAFARSNENDLLAYVERGRGMTYAGHDLWLTRNGHGTGFWDRGLGELGERLATAARKMGEARLYVGDDGRLHQ